MQKLLIKLFIKNHQNLGDPKVRSKYGTLSGIVGIISNLFLCTVKITLGLITMSLSIIADGINNLTDAFSSIITTIGFKISSTPADDDHPFGHERVEYVTGLIVSFLILIIGFSLGKESIIKLISKSTSTNITYITIIIMVISILIKLWQAMFYKKMATTIESKSLLASSKDSLNDCIATLSVIIGLILFKITSWWPVDGIIGIIVSIFIFLSGVKMTIETINLLIGTKPTQLEINEISKTILEYDGIIGIHDLLVHHYGKCTTFATVHVEMPSTSDIVSSHNIIDNIERDFKEKFGINLTIHLDPVELSNPTSLKIKEKITLLIKEISSKLSIHDFRIIESDNYTKILFDVVMPSKFSCSSDELKELIISEIKKLDNSYLPIIQVDEQYNSKID